MRTKTSMDTFEGYDLHFSFALSFHNGRLVMSSIISISLDQLIIINEIYTAVYCTDFAMNVTAVPGSAMFALL